MRQSRWYLHPILIFIFSVTAVALSLTLYIYWYVEVRADLQTVTEKANLDSNQVLTAQTWMVIMVLSILVGIILMGIFIIFVYNQKTFHLYRLQRNFIGNFTHELKTPVTSLKLYLETFRTYVLPREDQLKYIEYMVQDVDRLTFNINRILDLAKIESKTYGGPFERKDLVRTVERFYEKNRHLFDGCKIHIHNPTKRYFPYRISPPLFDILLMNLFTNAVKYNESEMPRLEITFQPRGRRLHVLFKDNGIGLERSEFRKVFKKFYQIGRADDMSAKGTGLGLYLVESIARFHKGKVIAESRGSGKGSVFALVLPFNTLRPLVKEESHERQ